MKNVLFAFLVAVFAINNFDQASDKPLTAAGGLTIEKLVELGCNSVSRLPIADKKAKATWEGRTIACQDPNTRKFNVDGKTVVGDKIDLFYFVGGDRRPINQAAPSVIVIRGVKPYKQWHFLFRRKGGVWQYIAVRSMQPLPELKWRLTFGKNEYSADLKFYE